MRGLMMALCLGGMMAMPAPPTQGQEPVKAKKKVTVTVLSMPGCTSCIHAKQFFEALHKKWPHFEFEYVPEANKEGGFPQIYFHETGKKIEGEPSFDGFDKDDEKTKQKMIDELNKLVVEQAKKR